MERKRTSTPKESDKEEEKEEETLIGGTLNIRGQKLDLGQLLSSPEDARKRLEQLREALKKAGGKEVLSDEEWRAGRTGISGQVRTHGALGEREYHIGTVGPVARERPAERQAKPAPPEIVEPPVDVFEEPNEVVVVAEVPGVDLEDLDLQIQNDTLFLSTRPEARRGYRKTIKLSTKVEPDTSRATCRNGILELHLQRKAA